MIKTFNNAFNILKIFLLLLSLMIIVCISLFMYHRLDQSIFGNNFLEFCSNILPFILLLMLFAINFSLKLQSINNDIFYNCSCFVALLSIILICYRTLCDQNMIFWNTEGFNINFTYFSDQLPYIKALVYLMIFTNVLLMIKNKIFIKKEINIL